MLPSLLISTLTDISYTGFKRGFCAFCFYFWETILNQQRLFFFFIKVFDFTVINDLAAH